MNNVDIGKYKRIVQYFWDPEPKNDDEPGSSIWCLGQEYHPSTGPVTENQNNSSQPTTVEWRSSPRSRSPASGPGADRHLDESQNGTSTGKVHATPREWPSPFLDDFESKIWLTYRSHFPAIPKFNDPKLAPPMTLGVRLRSQLVDSNGFTADTGWGCMIRSGQSLLANALSILSLGREWRRGSRVDIESRLLALFADDPRAPFSIHRFVEHGASACGKSPGEWFGPSATARCIEALSTECKDAGLNVYVTHGSDIYEARFRQIASAGTGVIRPTLILLGIRLGISRVTPAYWEALKAVLQYPQSVGIAGGRPSSSHYFVGVQGPYFFYLDPHHTRPALPYRARPEAFTEEELNSYHTRRLRRLHIKEMDPSMLIGFLIKDEDDWVNWKQMICSVPGTAIIHVSDDEASLFGPSSEREGAVDEVEALDEDYNDSDDEATSWPAS